MKPHILSSGRVVLPKSVVQSLRAIGFGLALIALYFGRGILAPLALATLIAFVMVPAVDRIERMRAPRGLAVALVCGCVGATVVCAGLLVSVQVEELFGELPRYQRVLETKLQDARDALATSLPLRSVGQALHTIDLAMQKTTSAVTGESASVASSSVQVVKVQGATGIDKLLQLFSPYLHALLLGGAVSILVIFLLLEWRDLRDRIVRLAGGNFERVGLGLCEASVRVRHYLGAQLMLNVGYGVVFGGVLALLGVPGALSWGILAGLLRFVPYAGPVIAAVGPLCMALVADPGWGMWVATAALVLVMELVTNNVLEPIIYGHRAGLSTVAILISATFWTALWGPIGLVLATPISVFLATMGRHIPRLEVFHVLLGNGPVDPQPAGSAQAPAADADASPEPQQGGQPAKSGRSPTAAVATLRRRQPAMAATVNPSL